MTVTGPVVLSEQAEAATSLLFRTLGTHRTIVAHLPAQPTMSRLRGHLDDREEIQSQATLLRLLSITEAFAAAELLRHVESILDPEAHLTISRIWDKAAVGATSGWAEQKNAYKNWLGVAVDWKPVERLAEARNAIAHGLGTLTRRQLRNRQSVIAKLTAAGITLQNDRIMLDDAVLGQAAIACRDFIAELDHGVQSRAAQYR